MKTIIQANAIYLAHATTPESPPDPRLLVEYILHRSSSSPQRGVISKCAVKKKKKKVEVNNSLPCDAPRLTFFFFLEKNDDCWPITLCRPVDGSQQ
jgi:hypothetical protein